jgi:hypothetical protein
LHQLTPSLSASQCTGINEAQTPPPGDAAIRVVPYPQREASILPPWAADRGRCAQSSSWLQAAALQPMRRAAAAAACSEPVTHTTPSRSKARSSWRAFSKAAARLAWMSSRHLSGLSLSRKAAACHCAARVPAGWRRVSVSNCGGNWRPVWRDNQLGRARSSSGTVCSGSPSRSWLTHLDKSATCHEIRDDSPMERMTLRYASTRRQHPQRLHSPTNTCPFKHPHAVAQPCGWWHCAHWAQV